MKKIIKILFGVLFILNSNAQELVTKSSLIGITLPKNTYRETSLTALTNTYKRMDSLVSPYSIKIDGQYAELLYTKADSVLKILKNAGWTIKTYTNSNLLEINKSTLRFMAYKNTISGSMADSIYFVRRW
jgi:hypothetical protein